MAMRQLTIPHSLPQHENAEFYHGLLGRNGPIVSRIGIGGWAMGGWGWGHVDDQQSVRAIRKAIQEGVTLFDTADVHGFGHSEEVLGQGLGADRNRVVICTKFGLRRGRDSAIVRDSSAERVQVALKESLRRLRIECIPLYLIHYLDGHSPLEETMLALEKMVRQGKIGRVGCSNFSADQLRVAHAAYPLSAFQAPYNLIDRKAEVELFPLCDELGIGVITHSSLAQGILSGKYLGKTVEFTPEDVRSRSPYFSGGDLERENVVRGLYQLGARMGVTPGQVAIRWVLEHPSVVTALTGVKEPGQVSENVEG